MAGSLVDQFLIMAQKGTGTNLLNVYKGVPLSFPAKIIEVGDTYLKVITDTYQMVCMYLEKSTLIQSEFLPEIVQAEVIELESKNHMALLSNFQFVEKGIGNRSEVRIQPKDPLAGSIQDKEDLVNFKGELADLSREGIGIYIDRSHFSGRLVYQGAQVDVIIDMPPEYFKITQKSVNETETGFFDRYSRENTRFNPISTSSQKFHTGPLKSETSIDRNLRISAQVVNIHLEKLHDRYRVGLRMNPTGQAFTAISRFITQRQSEIIQEIRELYHLLVSPDGSQSGDLT